MLRPNLSATEASSVEPFSFHTGVKKLLRPLGWLLFIVAASMEAGCRRAADPAPSPSNRVEADAPRRQRTPRAPKETREVRAQVFSVSDGDTVTVRDVDGGAQFRVRLRGIDAPERAQAFGQRSKQLLSDLVFNRQVRLVIYENDRYGRAVADIHVERGGAEVLANLEMIRAGLAWHYVRYDKRVEFAEAEKEARAAKRGLWADANPTPPWNWRRGAR